MGVKLYLLSGAAGDGPLDPEQGTADLVANGDLASLVCDCHGRGGPVMLTTGTAAGEETTAGLGAGGAGGAGGSVGGHGRCATAGAEETASASSAARAGGGCGGVAAGKHVWVLWLLLCWWGGLFDLFLLG